MHIFKKYVQIVSVKPPGDVELLHYFAKVSLIIQMLINELHIFLYFERAR